MTAPLTKLRWTRWATVPNGKYASSKASEFHWVRVDRAARQFDLSSFAVVRSCRATAPEHLTRSAVHRLQRRSGKGIASRYTSQSLPEDGNASPALNITWR